jgi:hypothetical protein
MPVEDNPADGHAGQRAATGLVITEASRNCPADLDIPARGRGLYAGKTVNCVAILMARIF